MSRRTRPSASASPSTRRVAIYTRKSTAQGLEKEFNSLDAQRDACESYVRSQPDWALLSERYDDGGFTGANLERPAFQRLLEDIDARRVDLVVVHKVDRLSRSLLDFAKVMDRLHRGGCAFVAVTQNFSTADAMGRLTLNMLMSFAEFEREMIAERTRDKIAGARRRGKWTGGRTPLGYRLDGGKLAVEELEALVVREIYESYLRHPSLVAVIEQLRGRGRTTKRHVSAAGTVQTARSWTKDSVLRILRSPVYAGLLYAGGELVVAEHEAIVTRQQFDAVRAALGANASGTQARSSERYLLAGLVRCAACGYGMTPASARPRGTEYRYYRCVTRGREGANACPTRPMPALELERIVVQRMREAATDEALSRAVSVRAEERIADLRRTLSAEQDALPHAIAKLGGDARRLANAFVEGGNAVRSQLEGRLEETNHQLRAHEARLRQVQAELGALDRATADATGVARTLGKFGDLWDAMTPVNRARLVRALVVGVAVDEARGEAVVEFYDGGGVLARTAA